MVHKKTKKSRGDAKDIGDDIDDDDDDGNHAGGTGQTPDDRVRDLATESDVLVLRASVVTLEKQLREADLNIISAIDANDFEAAKALNQHKKSLQDQLEVVRSRLADVQAEGVAGGGGGGGGDGGGGGATNNGAASPQDDESLEAGTKCLQRQLQEVDNEIAAQGDGDTLALEQKRLVLKAELEELRHRAVSSSAQQQQQQQPYHRDAGVEGADADRDADARTDADAEADASATTTQQRVQRMSTDARKAFLTRWVRAAAPLEKRLQEIDAALNDRSVRARPPSPAMCAKLVAEKNALLAALQREFDLAVEAGEVEGRRLDVRRSAEFERLSRLQLPPADLRAQLRAVEREIAHAVATDQFSETRALQRRRDALEQALMDATRRLQATRLDHQQRTAAAAAAAAAQATLSKELKPVRTDVGDRIAMELAEREGGASPLTSLDARRPPAGTLRSTKNNWSSGIRLSEAERLAIDERRRAVAAAEQTRSSPGEGRSPQRRAKRTPSSPCLLYTSPSPRDRG